MLSSWRKLLAIGAGAGLFVAGTATAQGGRSNLEPSVETERTYLANPMTGANEVPGPGDPAALGEAQVTVNKATGRVCIAFLSTLTGEITGLHIHEGAAGASGPVRVDFLGAGNTAPANLGIARCVNSTTNQVDAIVNAPANFYVNAHNASYSAGAIRAQLRFIGGLTGELEMLPEPSRVYDSRSIGKLAAGATRTVDIRQGRLSNGATGTVVFPGARAVLVTLTVTGSENAGYLQLYSASLDTPPQTSSINWSASGQDIAITTTVAVDAVGNVKVTAGPTGGTNFLIDVIGVYYRIG